MKNIKLFLIVLLVSLDSCEEKASIEMVGLNRSAITSINDNNQEDTFLHLIPSQTTGITFKNRVKEDEFRNHKSYTQIYNGGGVAIGDLNNDGLPDIYFAGNGADDKIYFNKGNLTFEDVTVSSGIKKYTGGWSYGVNMVDINQDGLLDIYVCKAGPYNVKSYIRNKLFINNGDGTFSEESADYKLDIDTYSVQAAFLDYDLDGDLDMYLANQPKPGSDKIKPDSFGSYVKDIRSGKLRTDTFYENVDGVYEEKTDDAGVVNYGYKNAVAVGDVNKDGYPDLYISTDFGEPDLFYLNNGDKTFTNKIDNNFKHISYYSMGSEFSDIDNDGNLDLYVTDMTPNDHVKSKVFMSSMDVAKFNAFVNAGFHHQYMLNTLQMNDGNASFSEVAQLAGIAKTDWSWAPLFFDIDLDGKKDLFVTNGIKENLNDNDIKEKVFGKQDELQRRLSLDEYLDVVPTVITPNQVFKNQGELAFKDTSKHWMDSTDFNSNGAAYADLDNDGDLDLVLNNMEAIAAIYENRAVAGKTGNSIAISLKGPKNNPFAIGTKISVKLKNQQIFHEHYLSRGYLSSVDPTIVLGVGTTAEIPSIEITWPDGEKVQLNNITSNSKITVTYGLSGNVKDAPKAKKPILAALNAKSIGLSYKHREDKIDDFKKQLLLPYSASQNGPFTDIADVNGDGKEDIFIGGAAGSPGALFLQQSDGAFKMDTNKKLWESDSEYEDLGVLFLDVDGDGDQDMYVASGGASFPEGSTAYQDRLYLNNGSGAFSKSQGALPKMNTSTQVVRANDVDNDGDLDLFIGGRIVPDKYPYTPSSYLLLNEAGVYKDMTTKRAEGFMKAGLVTGAEFTDYDMDGDKDLIISAEWQPLQIFNNSIGHFTKVNSDAFIDTEGIWFSLMATDLDGDGDEDLLAGNLGLNSKFTAKPGKPFHVYCDDFDSNGTYDIVFSKDYNGNLVPMRGRECSSQQMPFITDKFSNFSSFANATLEDIMGKDKLDASLHYQVEDFSSAAFINDGKGNFTRINLPREAQVSPIMDFMITDLDSDGISEIILVGNLYPTEVETTRYDASRGLVLRFVDGAFDVVDHRESGLNIARDSKSLGLINQSNRRLLVIGNNNDEISVLEMPKS
jgi:hypothetical protein